MFKKILLALAVISSAVIYSCSTKEPYYVGEETPIHDMAIHYTYYEPEWPEDEEGNILIPYELLVDSVDYLMFPPQASKDQFIDSLVYLYNLITLNNAFDTDALTYSRDLANPSHVKPGELDWIKDGELRDLFVKLDKAVCNIKSRDDLEEYDQSSSDVKDYINDNLFKALYAKVDTAGLDKIFAPTTYVEDIKSLHKMILTDSVKAFKTLQDRVFTEKYFIPQSYLAVEYALSHYANPNFVTGRSEPLAGLLEQIMRADIYAPNLTTIWRMWRVRNQFYQSPSNDGPIYNHYYNTFRNRIAKTYLEHYIKTKAPDALHNFLELAIEPNIVRDGLFGNFATFEDMDLFWIPTRKEYNQEPA